MILTGGLFLLDYEGLSNDTPTSLLTQTLKNWMDRSPINQQLIDKTSLRSNKLNLIGSNNSFFAPYIETQSAEIVQHYSIPAFDIGIEVVSSKKPAETLQKMTKTPQNGFRFHMINETTFYLNQEPIEQKTHNYLARQVGNNVLGFIYPPLHHQKVLEIIDALEENE